MPELSGPFEECLTAVKERRNLQEILRHYPAERDDLIGMLRLSVDLSNLGAPTPDPAFRLRARNRMLGLAGQRRLAQRRNPFTWLPRPEAQRLFSVGRKDDAVALVSEYDTDVARFKQSVASASLDDGAISDLRQLVQERRVRADASLNSLAGSLSAQGDAKTAAIVTQTQSHVDQALRGSSSDLQAHASNAHPTARPAKPAGAQH